MIVWFLFKNIKQTIDNLNKFEMLNFKKSYCEICFYVFVQLLSKHLLIRLNHR